MNSEIVNFFLQYIQHEKRCSDHTVTAYRKDMAQFVEYLTKTYDFHHPQLADHQMIRSWVVSLSEAKLDSRSINRKIATLRSFFKFLQQKKIIDQDPMRKVLAMKTTKNIPTFVREAELDNLLDDVEFPESFEGVRDKLILELLYGTGMRLSELIDLEVRNIDFYGQTVKVLGKRNKERIIPINQSLAHQIELYIQCRNQEGLEHQYLIVSEKGNQAYPVMIQRIVKKYLSLVTSLTKKSPHVLRHSYATHLLNNGADLTAIKDLMGHTSLSATQVYTHNSMEKIRKIYEQAHPKA
ncbi:tyrosine-type recombinase/integrase [Flectobacillus major]|jgi:integrase/recombinase XerC|uniref:tyrosine-type recombinase/integrase n=1 Tax=Flectobacillus major TaxID=103 RepID=UPI0005C492C7|nr:tyrosine-type recombinase/integrase [Flectobacillus major]